MGNVVGARNKIVRWVYRVSRGILFKFDSEKMHNMFTSLGSFFGSNFLTRGVVSLLFNYRNKKLEQEVFGIKFRNPVGLAAGFDYEGKMAKVMPSVGFGWQAIGSVTFGSYEGNAPPRLGRLIKSKALLVNKGLKNSGAENVVKKFLRFKSKIPFGVSVAKTNCKETADDKKGIKDYVSSFKIFEKSNVGDFYELNISCPNAFGGEPFTTPAKLEKLLKEIDKLKLKKPLLLKMPVDFSILETDKLCKVAARHKVEGLIFGNLTKSRKNTAFDKSEIAGAGKGNFSGKPTEELSNKLIAFAYKKYGKRFVIVGCGGVFSAEDAYKKIKLGASLIQLITGMIYEGSGLIGEINLGLVKLLEKDGVGNIGAAVGRDNGS